MLSSCLSRAGASRDFIPTAVISPQSTDAAPMEVLQRYMSQQISTAKLTDYSVDVEIEAALPSMHRQGGMKATRVLSGGTNLAYRNAEFTGDNSIKGDVITRYLNGDRDSLKNPVDVSITETNYTFEHRGIALYNDHRVHVFEVIPKVKRVGLYRGELWIDIESGRPLREFGRFVKSPSVFLKNVDFVRDYLFAEDPALKDRTLPARFISTMDTRIVGPAELTVHFKNYKFSNKE